MEEMKTTLVKYLVDLGNNPLSVANRLKEMNIGGYRNNCRGCPIARYLTRHPLCFGLNVEVDESEIQVGNIHIRFWEHPELNGVRGFIFEFDDGDFDEVAWSHP